MSVTDTDRRTDMSLDERRAWFVYEAARLAAIAARAPIIPEEWHRRDMAFCMQFIDVIRRQSGPERSADAEALHEEWVVAYEKMGWRYGPTRDPVEKTHPDMVPYENLGQLERDKDDVFVALCEIARKWIYEADLCAYCGDALLSDPDNPTIGRTRRDGTVVRMHESCNNIANADLLVGLDDDAQGATP